MELILRYILVFSLIGCARGQDCIAKDCVVSSWSGWSFCSQTCGDSPGTSTRQRTVLEQPTCGGQCNYNLTQSQECGQRCCPKDCTYSDWMVWATCDRVCDPDTVLVIRRTVKRREKLTEPSCGGYCSNHTSEQTCGNLCCLLDCIEGEWGPWGTCKGTCEQMGMQERTRNIIQFNKCGGKPCSYATEERECLVGCCPVDCVVMEWTEWSACNTTCGTGHRTRSRRIQQPECGGKACPLGTMADETEECERDDSMDCEVGMWSSWSDCELDNGRCGEGQKNRTRDIYTHARCLGQPCPSLLDTALCNGPCCPQDCEVSEWSPWGPCSTDCGEGVSTRTRTVIQPAECEGQSCPSLKENKNCFNNETTHCEMTPWSLWSDCSTNCGNGTIFRSRSLVTMAYCGGEMCQSMSLEETQDCSSEDAKQDCQVTSWSEWTTSCIKTCDGGRQTRYRSVTLTSECGGQMCPQTLILSDWGEWGACKRTCTGGLQVRQHSIVSPAICGGKECIVEQDNRTCHELCSQNCEDGICSCQPGFKLISDGISCEPVVCPKPRIELCPPGYSFLINCLHPDTSSCTEYSFNKTCTPKCFSGWVLKGSPGYIICQQDGQWSQPEIFCTLPNNPPTNVYVKTSNNIIIDGTAAGSVITYLGTEDKDSIDKHTYTLVSNPMSRFRIENDKLILNITADFKIKPIEWTITIRSTDIDGAFVEKNFLYIIEDKNDPPSSVKLSNKYLPENSLPGTEVGCLIGEDEESGSNLTYKLIDSNMNAFKLVNSSGQTCVVVAAASEPECPSNGGAYCALNREKQKYRFFTVLASDTGSPPLFTIFDLLVTLTDVNDRPSDIILDPLNVKEGKGPGEPIAVLTAVDEDKGQKHTFKLLTNADGLFQLNGNNLTCTQVLDYESMYDQEYSITVETIDDGDPQLNYSRVISFKIGDENEPPFDLLLTAENGQLPFEHNKPKIKENLNSVNIGTVYVKDQDFGDMVMMSLADDFGGHLQLLYQRCDSLPTINTMCSAQLISRGSGFNFEETPFLNLTIIARDSGGLESTINMSLEVLNQNDPPQDILVNNSTSSALHVDENENSFVIGMLSATDEDATDTFRFFLADSAGGKFVMSNNYLQTSALANLDYEKQNMYTIKVMVEDSGQPRMNFDKIFTVHVVDVNERPTNIELSIYKVPENSPNGYEVCTLSTVDPDNAVNNHQTFTYDLLNDSKGRFTVDGDKLKVAQSDKLCGIKECILNYEEEDMVLVSVEVSDSGLPPLQYIKNIWIEVEDKNDPPQDIRLAGNTIRENAPAGTDIGMVMYTEEDAGQSAVVELLTHKHLFEIIGANTLATKSPLDHEEEFQYNLTIKCTDNGIPAMSTESVVLVDVLDINEPPLYTGHETLQVSEDVPMGHVVSHMTAADPDHDEKLVFLVTNTEDKFQIINVTCGNKLHTGTECVGQLITTQSLDFEKQKEYHIKISIRDKENQAAVQDILIQVTDANDPPTALFLDDRPQLSLRVPENTKGELLAKLNASDPDPGQSFSYSLEAPESKQFTIVGSELRVSPEAELDFETQSQYIIGITVIDSGLPPRNLTKYVTIDVVNQNEPPATVSLTNNQVAENSNEGTIVGLLEVEDPDNRVSLEQTFTYVLVDNAGGRFKVKDQQLLVAASNVECLQYGGDSCLLNYEREHEHFITVLVQDSGVPSKQAEFILTVEVTNRNDPPRNIRISNFQIDVSADLGSEVGQLSVEDEDQGQAHEFSLSDDDGGLFIVSPEGLVTKATSERLDLKTLYSLQVRVTDSGDEPMQATEVIAISVTGDGTSLITINFTPEEGVTPFPTDQPTLRENLPIGTVIGQLVATDHQADKQLSLLLQSQSGNEVVQLDGMPNCVTQEDTSVCSSKVVTVTVVDYEFLPGVSLLAQASAEDGSTSVKAFDLKIEDVNEPPQSIIYSGDHIEVQENSKPQIIGRFLATDEDKEEILSFSLADDADGKFVITIDGYLSTTGSTLDFESKPRENITVKVTDSANQYIEEIFEVEILDVNEPPRNIQLSSNEVDEMAPAGTVIGTVTAEDPEQSQIITFSLVDDANGRFLIEGDKLKVKAQGSGCSQVGISVCLLDYETQNSYEIIIKAEDSGLDRQFVLASLTITLRDVNDPPYDLQIVDIDLPESAEIGTTVASFKAKDKDKNQTLSFTIVEGNDDGVFSMAGNSLILQKTVDYEEAQTFNLTIQAQDNGPVSLSITKAFSLPVRDENERPTSLSFETKPGESLSFIVNKPKIGENSVKNTLIGQLVALDYDHEDTITFSNANREVAVFNQQCIPLTKGVRCTCDVRSAIEYDYETAPTISLSFSAADKEGLDVTISVTMQVLDENDPPTNIFLNGEATNYLSVPEDQEDIVIATLTSADEDVGQSHSYSMQTQTDTFYIVDDKLKVSQAGLNYEETPRYELVIRVTDDAKNPQFLERTITVDVENVNEAPTDIILSKNMFPEDSQSGDTIGAIVVIDPDNSGTEQQTFTITLLNDTSGLFEIDGDFIKVKEGNFDFEKLQFYTITIKVEDSGIPSQSKNFKVKLEVTDANDPPTNLKFSATSLKENEMLGAVVGTLSAEDEDAGQTVSFTTTSYYFTVTGNSVIVSGPINYEKMPSVTFSVTASDDAIIPASVSKNFTIQVEDVNEQPSSMEFLPSSMFSDMMIPEDTKIGDVLGVIEVIDPDHGDHVTLKLTENTDNSFLLSPSSPACVKKEEGSVTVTKCSYDLKLAKILNYETSKDTMLRALIEAVDSNGLFLSKSWTFGISNSNEPPYDITIDGGTYDIPENMPNFLIGALNSLDEDKEDTHKYQVLTYWEIFAIHPPNKLVAKPALDFEKKSTYKVTIRSVDSNAKEPLSFAKEFEFHVKNVNEQPSSILVSPTQISNGATAGMVVSKVTVADPDNEGQDPPVQSHTCNIGGSAAEIFTLSGDQIMVTKDILGMEVAELDMSLTCTDDDPVSPLTLSVNVTFTIDEEVPIPKELVLLEQKDIPENTGDYVVGTLKIINSLSYKEVSGDFTYTLDVPSLPFQVVNDQLQVITPLDYEAQSEWTVVCHASGVDALGTNVSVIAEFQVDVLDVNEAPYHISLRGGSQVRENSPPGTLVGELMTDDVEPDPTHYYEILNITSGGEKIFNAFVLEGGAVVVGADNSALNYEESKYFSLSIKTTDSGGLSFTEAVLVSLLDINDAPTEIILSHSSVPENSLVDTKVGDISVTDEDGNQVYSCVVNNKRSVPFKVANKLELVVSREDLDFEQERIYAVEIVCVDDSEERLQISKTFTLNVTNVNEAPEDIRLSSYHIQEDNNIGEAIGEIKATDLDSNRVAFTINGESAFSIQGENTLVANEVFNYEDQSEYKVQITATDEEGLHSSQIMTIMVTDVNETPLDILLDNNRVDENSKPGTMIGSLTTIDSDIGQRFTYTIIQKSKRSTAVSDFFQIAGDQLVTGDTLLDHEAQDEIVIYIKSTDDDEVDPKSVEKEFRITVNDVNEPPESILVPNIESISEFTAVNTDLGAITVVDPDEGGKPVCQVETQNVPFTIGIEEDHSATLVLSHTLDYEEKAFYNLSIRCSDGEFAISKEIFLQVKDENEAPTAIKLSGSRTITADAKPGQEIGTLQTVDPDHGQKHSYIVFGPYADIVKVDESSKLVLQASVPKELLSQESPIMILNITSADNGIPSLDLTQTFSILITDIPVTQPPQLPEVLLDRVSIKESAVAGQNVGALFDVNTTIGENVILHFVDNPDDLFKISEKKYLILNRNLTDIDGDTRKIVLQVKDTETFEELTKTIIVTILAIDNCKKADGQSCHANARCVELNSTLFECQCELGYVGNGYSCTNEDNCNINTNVSSQEVINPCQNSASCIDGLDGFSCQCPTGYSGQLCDISDEADDPCVTSPCKNFGICVADAEDESKANCLCEGGWEGSLCEVNIDDCEEAKCFGGAKCIDKINNYVCECPNDRYGPWCQYITSACDNSECSDGAEVCVPFVNKENSICAQESSDLVQLVFKMTKFGFDKAQYEADISKLIEDYFKRSLNEPKARRKRYAEDALERERRSVDENDRVQVYIVAVKDLQNGSVEVDFLVLDTASDVYTKEEVLSLLSSTCSDLDATNNADPLLCPVVSRYIANPLPKDQGENASSGPPIGIIAGAIGGVLVVAVIVIVIIICKKKKDNAIEDSTKKSGL